MTPLFKKLNLKDHQEILVLSAPDSMDPEVEALEGVKVHRSASRLKQVDFGIAFVTNDASLRKAVEAMLPKAEGDAVIWFAYPKKTSKKYKSDIDRDHGWEPVGEAGFEPVRQVAIDDDWSALRFRRTSYIKTLKRNEAMRLSPEGRARSKAK
ncbi:MAG TPA: hypothetical protein VF190_00350 [Rhodothermales bacterium]